MPRLGNESVLSTGNSSLLWLEDKMVQEFLKQDWGQKVEGQGVGFDLTALGESS
jgi:hypothetical protein